MPKTNVKSERLELAMAINQLTAKQDAFNKAVETLEKYQTEILPNLDLEIETKKIELLDLEDSFKRNKKDGEIELDQFLAEHKYDGAVQILADRNEVPIKEDRLSSLEAEIEELRKDQTEKLNQTVSEERAKAKETLNAALNSCKLTHKADTAELIATVNQQKREIVTLQSTIDNLKVELAEQRKLTRDVAEAGRASAITQNLGK